MNRMCIFRAGVRKAEQNIFELNEKLGSPDAVKRSEQCNQAFIWSRMENDNKHFCFTSSQASDLYETFETHERVGLQHPSVFNSTRWKYENLALPKHVDEFWKVC